MITLLHARQLVMIRAEAKIPAEPDPLFAFFTSVAGYKVIDPLCNNHDDKPLRQWSERCAYWQRSLPDVHSRGCCEGKDGNATVLHVFSASTQHSLVMRRRCRTSTP